MIVQNGAAAATATAAAAAVVAAVDSEAILLLLFFFFAFGVCAFSLLFAVLYCACFWSLAFDADGGQLQERTKLVSFCHNYYVQSLV